MYSYFESTAIFLLYLEKNFIRGKLLLCEKLIDILSSKNQESWLFIEIETHYTKIQVCSLTPAFSKCFFGW